jgi:hypothetical protein
MFFLNMSMRSVVGFFLLVGAAPAFAFFAPFALSASSSPKKTIKTNQEEAAGGFGKKADIVPVSHMRDESPSTQNLVDFLHRWKSEGLGEDAGTEIGFNENGFRGVYATKPFNKGDIICKIPSDCALALADPSVATEETLSIANSAANFLQWYVMNPEARKQWSCYLDTLPTTEANFDPTPDFWTDEEINQLEFPMIIKQAMERKEQIAELALRTNIPFDELQFATWLVASRSFSIKITVDDAGLVRKGAVSTREQGLRVLLPYLDMINHSDDFNSELHLIDPEKDDAWFAIRAKRPIKKNKEITISYGAAGTETSLGLLMNYGFIQAENKFDSLLLKKGGDDCIESLDGWNTTLEEDEKQLADGGVSGNMVSVLRFRTKLKRSYPPTK